MYLSVTKEPRPDMNPPADISKAEAWDAASIGLGVLNCNLEINFCNPYLQALLDSNEQALAGQNFLQFLDVDNQLRTHIAGELTALGQWQGIIHSSNHALRIEIKRNDMQPADGSSGHEAVYSLVIIDYSADYKKLKELSTAKSLAEKTDKAKSRFLSHMSHELRTPLNAILGFTQLMNVETDLSDLQQDNLKEIEAAGNYLLTLINEILDLSRIEAGKIRLSEDTVYLEQLLAECLALVKPIADKKNIGLECILTTERQLHTDHVRLKQVILNLISNAIKYNTENGLVVLYCHDVDEENIRIEIQDSGPGIAADMLSNIFSPFERLGLDDKKNAGSGIGLMIARRLTKLMGGKIDVLSEPGRGSVFWLDLPAVSLDAVEFQYFHEAAAGRIAFTAEPWHVTYIGDDETFVELLRRLPTIRERIQPRIFTDIAQASGNLSFTAKTCVFVSEKIAREFAGDDSKRLPGNLSLIVVKDKHYSEIDPAHSQPVQIRLPESFKITDLLRIIDNCFQDGF